MTCKTMLPPSGNDSETNTVALPTSNTSAPPMTSQISKRTRKPQSTTTSTSLSSLFMTSTITNRPTQSYMEGDTVPKNAILSRDRLTNKTHLATISTSNETRTAITSPTSTIVSLLPTSLTCLSTTLRLLVPVIHPL